MVTSRLRSSRSTFDTATVGSTVDEGVRLSSARTRLTNHTKPTATSSTPVTTASRNLESVFISFSWELVGTGDGKFHAEPASDTVAFHFHDSPMRGANGFNNGEPQAGSFGIAGSSFVHAEESFKNVRQRISRNAYAVI